MKRACAVFASVLLALCLTVPAFGDMGPKDQLTVRVVNPPEEAYYLDLLYAADRGGINDNLSSQRDTLDSALLEQMRLARPEGYALALINGTDIPCWGNFVGEAQPDGSMTHTFSYHGVPETYRIQLVTASGTVYQSAAYTRPALQSGVTLDYATGTVTTPSVLGAYVLQFLSTCLPTLIIEGLVLMAFGFSLKKNWLVFLATNLVTQIVLTALAGTALLSYGPTFLYLRYLLVEIAIAMAEAAVYYNFLSGRSRKRAAVYAFAANAASYLVGAVTASWQFQLMTTALR